MNNHEEIKVGDVTVTGYTQPGGGIPLIIVGYMGSMEGMRMLTEIILTKKKLKTCATHWTSS